MSQAETEMKTRIEELAAEVASHRRGRVPRELRRRQVLAAAHGLFLERGYVGASMDELARRVGVSKPVIYDIAGSKEALFHDVMATVDEELTAEVAAAVSSEMDDRARLRAGILAFLRFVRDRGDAWAALLSTDSGPPKKELKALRSRQAKIVAGLIAARVGTSDPRTAEVVAQAINGAVEFVSMWWQEHPDVPAEALADVLTATFSTDLFELAAKPLT